MKKIALIAVAAMVMLTACTNKETASIDGTRWYYSKVDNGRTITCSMTLQKGGEISIHDKYESYYTAWNDTYNYLITFYSYDGDTHGEITVSESGYSGEKTFSYTLYTNKSKLAATFPSGHSLTLELR